MPINENSTLKQSGYLLTRSQIETIDRLAIERSSVIRKVSKSEAAREVIAAGLGVIVSAPTEEHDECAQ